MVSGVIYTLRNDTMHGASISITKSSKVTMSTYANSYFAFLVMYYLTIILMINKYSPNMNGYDALASNIEQNIDLFVELFGNHIGR